MCIIACVKWYLNNNTITGCVNWSAQDDFLSVHSSLSITYPPYRFNTLKREKRPKIALFTGITCLIVHCINNGLLYYVLHSMSCRSYPGVCRKKAYLHARALDNVRFLLNTHTHTHTHNKKVNTCLHTHKKPAYIIWTE